MTRTTKLVLAIIIGALILLASWFLASLFLAPEAPGASRRSFLFFPGGGDGGTPPGTQTLPPGGLEGAGDSNLLQITKDPIIGATLAGDKVHLLFYRREGGNLFQTDLEGKNETKVTHLTVLGITDVVWSPTKEQAIVAYLANNELKHFIQNAATSSTNFLPENLTSAAWSPEGARIVYTRLGTRGSEVITANPSGGNARAVYTERSPDWRAQWIATTTLILTTSPTYALPGLSLFLSIGQGTAEYSSLIGLQILPAFPTNTYAIFSTDSRGGMAELRFQKRTGDPISVADVRTLQEKCTWNHTFTTLYCAAPERAKGYANLPDEWLKGKITFRDRIIKITPQNGAIETLVPSSGFDAVGLFLDSEEKFLFFVHKTDSTLWRLELK